MGFITEDVDQRAETFLRTALGERAWRTYTRRGYVDVGRGLGFRINTRARNVRYRCLGWVFGPQLCIDVVTDRWGLSLPRADWAAAIALALTHRTVHGSIGWRM